MALWMGLLALEREADRADATRLLSRACAHAMVGALLQQMTRSLPLEHVYGFAWAAAFFDPAEILRRGFPVHRELGHLFAAGQREGLSIGQSVTFSEALGHMPTPVFSPDPTLGDGQFQVIPVVLIGSDEAIAAASERLENDLYEHGLADAGIVMTLSQELKRAPEHVRWMSVLDLAAMMAAQLEAVGLGAAWTLIEEQLLADEPRSFETKSVLNQSLRLRDGSVAMAFRSYAMHARQHTDADLHHYLASVHEFRQMSALFEAHGIPIKVHLDGEPVVSTRIDNGLLTESHRDGPATRYLLHTHIGLGALAWTGADDKGALVEQVYPLSRAAIARFSQGLKSNGVHLEISRTVQMNASGSDLATIISG